MALALVVLYLLVFAHATTVRASDQEFSFGFVMPPLALALFWLRRARLRQVLGRGANLGLVPLGCGMLMLVLGARSGIHVVEGASFGVTMVGAVAYLYGVGAARVLLLRFPHQ